MSSNVSHPPDVAGAFLPCFPNQRRADKITRQRLAGGHTRTSAQECDTRPTEGRNSRCMKITSTAIEGRACDSFSDCRIVCDTERIKIATHDTQENAAITPKASTSQSLLIQPARHGASAELPLGAWACLAQNGRPLKEVAVHRLRRAARKYKRCAARELLSRRRRTGTGVTEEEEGYKVWGSERSAPSGPLKFRIEEARLGGRVGECSSTFRARITHAMRRGVLEIWREAEGIGATGRVRFPARREQRSASAPASHAVQIPNVYGAGAGFDYVPRVAGPSAFEPSLQVRLHIPTMCPTLLPRIPPRDVPRNARARAHRSVPIVLDLTGKWQRHPQHLPQPAEGTLGEREFGTEGDFSAGAHAEVERGAEGGFGGEMAMDFGVG
ncbi:hypothetical protein FB451DRAFT_1170222 [Mycena latifolia]|nr:hypothetical protein FB451DRAFT_1170222 [Mycena latifolia]